jgi:cob(I)alamin adenosyltransferase
MPLWLKPPLPLYCLETEIATILVKLTPLDSFILPGGTPAAAHAHLARTVVRRAERHVVTLSQAEAINMAMVRYLNRLSDYLFVVARQMNDDGRGDVKWIPGQNL